MMPKPARGERVKKNTAKKMDKSTAMPGGNGKVKKPVKKKPKENPMAKKKKMMAVAGGNGKQKKRNA